MKAWAGQPPRPQSCRGWCTVWMGVHRPNMLVVRLPECPVLMRWNQKGAPLTVHAQLSFPNKRPQTCPAWGPLEHSALQASKQAGKQALCEPQAAPGEPKDSGAVAMPVTIKSISSASPARGWGRWFSCSTAPVSWGNKRSGSFIAAPCAALHTASITAASCVAPHTASITAASRVPLHTSSHLPCLHTAMGTPSHPRRTWPGCRPRSWAPPFLLMWGRRTQACLSAKTTATRLPSGATYGCTVSDDCIISWCLHAWWGGGCVCAVAFHHCLSRRWGLCMLPARSGPFVALAVVLGSCDALLRSRGFHCRIDKMPD